MTYKMFSFSVLYCFISPTSFSWSAEICFAAWHSMKANLCTSIFFKFLKIMSLFGAKGWKGRGLISSSILIIFLYFLWSQAFLKRQTCIFVNLKYVMRFLSLYECVSVRVYVSTMPEWIRMYCISALYAHASAFQKGFRCRLQHFGLRIFFTQDQAFIQYWL